MTDTKVATKKTAKKKETTQFQVQKNSRNWPYWAATFLIFCYFVYTTKSVIMPFVAGMLIGYLFDPLVQKLTKLRINRTIATTIVLLLIISIFVPVIFIIIKLANEQIINFLQNLPKFASSLSTKVEPIVKNISAAFPELAPVNIKEYMIENAERGVKIIGSLIAKIINQSFAFINLLSLLIITPVVAFYMLRDWAIFTKKFNDLLPLKSKKDIRSIIDQIDRAMAGFIRGQLSVCLILGTIYSLGLYATGLHLGVVVGFVAGIISFIPYVGSITGFVTAITIALIQFNTPGPIIAVAGVFLFGQMLEGLYLTPKLVGDSVGLHPVWVMFALLAGGVILGFLGIMIAVPVAAIIGILIKHFIEKYKKSEIYRN